MTKPATASAGPLKGFKVVELASYAAGPSAGAILADWGAEVIKVEPPAGDPFRRLANTNPAAGNEYTSADQDNRGKRSIAIDLGKPEGMKILRELIGRCDVFLTNMRAPALKKLKLDYESQAAAHPRLVYAWLTGYGTTGRDADEPAFDAGTWWGRAGVALQLLPGGAEPMFHAGAIGDHSTGLALSGGICAALLARERSGRGQRVDASLLRSGAFFIASDLYAELCNSPNPKYTKQTRPNPLVLPYQTKDGKWMMMLGVEPDRVWPCIARAIGQPELATKPEYATAAARNERRAEVSKLLDAALVQRTRDEWAEIFRREAVWWAPINETADLPRDPQMRAAGCFAKVPTRFGEREMVPAPVDFSATPWSIAHGSPAVGEHTVNILRDLGKSEADVDALRTAGVVK